MSVRIESGNVHESLNLTQLMFEDLIGAQGMTINAFGSQPTSANALEGIRAAISENTMSLKRRSQTIRLFRTFQSSRTVNWISKDGLTN